MDYYAPTCAPPRSSRTASSREGEGALLGLTSTPIGKKFSQGKASLAEPPAHAAKIPELADSGKQESLECLFNGYAYGK